MTFILVKRINGVPAIFGDLLISELNNPNPHTIDLPALKAFQLDQILPREESFPSVKGLERKIAKINKNFVIAWSGSLLSAKAIIRGLFLTFSEKVPSISDLFAYFGQYKDDRVPDLVIIGWTLDGSDYQSFHWNFDTNQGLSGDEVYVAGSGAHPVGEIISNSKGTVEGKISHYERFMGEALGLITTLKGDELFTGNSIYAAYGGGFEFVYLQNNQFTYPPKMSHLFWNNLYISEKNQFIKFIPHIIEYWYEEDDLIIRSHRLEIMDNYYSLNERHIYILSPLTKDSPLNEDDEDRLVNSSFVSSIYSIFVYAAINGTEFCRKCSIPIYDYRNSGLIITSNDELRNYISFDDDIYNIIKKHVHHAVINNN